MAQPLDQTLIDGLRKHGLLKMNSSQIERLQEFLMERLRSLDDPDQDADWVAERREYYLHAWRDDFLLLSESVDSPVEQQLGGYLLCITDGYSEIRADFFRGAFPDPAFGTFFRCQQQLFQYRVDFVFKLNVDGDWNALVVECDGHDFHERTKEQAARDRSRDRFLIHEGFEVIRFTGSEIYNKPRKCAAEVEAVLARMMWDLLAAHGKERKRRPPLIPD